MTAMNEEEASSAGLQLERTSLAWRRLALTLLALALAQVQVGWPILGGWTLAPAGVVAVGAIAILGGAQRRYAASLHSMARSADVTFPNGWLIAATAISTTILAIAAVLIVSTGTY